MISSGVDESDEVLAFIAERRGPVLRDAVATLADASADDLPAVVHRIHGILGSYGLTDAHAVVAALAETLADPATGPDQAQVTRENAVTALRALTVEPVA